MFQRLEVEDGLSQSMIYSMLQDDRGFIWFGTQDGLNRYDGRNFKVYRDTEMTSLGNDGICSLAKDDKGDIWVGTVNGLYIFHPKTDDFSHVDTGMEEGLVRSIAFNQDGDAFVTMADTCILHIHRDGRESSHLCLGKPYNGIRIRGLCIDADDNLWVATYSAGLLCIKPGGEILQFSHDGAGQDMFTKVIQRDSETLLVGTIEDGLLVFDRRSRRFLPVENADGETARFIHDILKDSRGRIWIGCENGLHILDEDGNMTNLRHIPGDPYSLSDNAVFSLAEDNEGGVWVGTYFGGVNYWSGYSSQFKKYFPIPGHNRLLGKNISEFQENGDGKVWIGTEDGGLHLFDRAAGTFESGFVPSDNIHALNIIGGDLWVGTYGDGLYVLGKNNRIKQHRKLSAISGSLRDDNVFSIVQTLDGTVWIGTEDGLYISENAGGNFRRIAPLVIHSQVNDICEDFDGNIWIATGRQGIIRRSQKTGIWENPVPAPVYPTCILEDAHHNLWFGTTDDGILFYDRQGGSFDKSFGLGERLPDNMVYMLLEDGRGNIWGSTNHGIFRLSEEDGEVRAFDHESGLTCDQYNFKSGMRAGDGELFFGGVKGFVSFDADNIRWPQEQSNIVFNRFLLYNNEVDIREKDSPLEESIIYADKITLKSSQSVFSVGFADLNFCFNGVRNYQYRLLGLDRNWLVTDLSQMITFSDLRPGHYTLEVRAVKRNDIESDTIASASIAIQVLPPWYLTIWAFIGYLLLACAFCVLVAYWLLREYRKRNAAILEKVERRKEKELYNSKISFFTQITHEIRTPLTLITAPIASLIEKTDKDSPIYDDLDIVQRNADRLLTLVNELLDFRKVEAGTILPNYVHCDMLALTSRFVEDFKSIAKSRGIEMELMLPDPIEADIDRELYKKIVSNVIGNACKHASSIIRIQLSKESDTFMLSVMNDGERIPESEAEHIFEPFVKLYDNIPGSGMGLPFTRTLATTMGGSIVLDTSSEMTSFVLTLPLIQENVVSLNETTARVTDNSDSSTSDVEDSATESVSAQTSPEVSTDAARKDYRVLVVDDNEDFRIFLSRVLSDNYEVLTASDGAEAKKVLASELVDLVITDLMMPGVDGMSLCSSIREDIATSHIPVILLTAKSDMDTKIRSISLGADDFISKPFQPGYLKVRMENLLKSRENLRQAFCKSPELEVSSMATSSIDKEFLDRLTQVIEEKMESPQLDVDVLADAMHMSRATLYRKMKGVTKFSANEFIRICRLRKAAALLAERKLPVQDIAFLVGFNSVSYFSRCFSKQFGVSPKDYADSQTGFGGK